MSLVMKCYRKKEDERLQHALKQQQKQEKQHHNRAMKMLEKTQAVSDYSNVLFFFLMISGG